MADRRIGEAAALVGVETHVLRHWEDVGVLMAPRSTTGHRVYDDDAISRAVMIRRCQRAGLSLAQIRALRPANGEARRSLVQEHRAQISEVIEQLRATDEFLRHLLSCRHATVAQCPECSAFSRS